MTLPFRLGFLTHLRGTDDPLRVYQETLDLFSAADQLGYDVGWVAQHHFIGPGGSLPSPFPFLATVMERTKQLRLGTSIVVLPLEVPLRVAEDAAVLDLLSGGRLELGVGSGGDPREFQAFAVDVKSRHERTTAGLIALKAALRGETLGDSDKKLQPPAPTLVDRMWLSGLSEIGATYAARHEVGLLLSRAAWTNDEPTDVVQLPVAQAYQNGWTAETIKPRIGLSRGIFVSTDKRTALAELGDDIMHNVDTMVRQGRMTPGLSLEQYCERLHIAYGHPEEAAAMLAADRVLPYAADLILQFDPAFPPLDRAIEMLEQIATVVAPALGWQPVDSRTAA
jgi:alkanesulfonate monooxygenase SsuD/methylene tetrahydromethanopterin reductase-like flavin-dependent oxidoreductase (luciferase family)